ncbi:hypothetical protein ACIBHY_36200 [Nonomuraea sp. NPDC050547]|uniref:hypothetical protein n=1 Tax=Nonomuraea sp. NPDC050547 TaxID=3364368 RepID=UPI0037AD34F9
MEDSAEPVASVDVQVEDARRFGDRVGGGAEWSRLVEGLMGAVLVVEAFVLAQGVA